MNSSEARKKGTKVTVIPKVGDSLMLGYLVNGKVYLTNEYQAAVAKDCATGMTRFLRDDSKLWRKQEKVKAGY